MSKLLLWLQTSETYEVQCRVTQALANSYSNVVSEKEIQGGE